MVGSPATVALIMLRTVLAPVAVGMLSRAIAPKPAERIDGLAAVATKVMLRLAALVLRPSVFPPPSGTAGELPEVRAGCGR